MSIPSIRPVDNGSWPEVYAIENLLADYHEMRRPWGFYWEGILISGDTIAKYTYDLEEYRKIFGGMQWLNHTPN